MQPQLTGISPLVDSCARMICAYAQSSYKRISPTDQRWIEPCDVIQEGLMAAVEAEARYGGIESGTKFSSYLPFVLRSRYDDAFHKWPNQIKRRAPGMVELDAPLQSNSAAGEAPTSYLDTVEAVGSVKADRCYELAHAFVKLCALVSVEAAEFLVGGLLGGTVVMGLRTIGAVSVLVEIREAVDWLGLTYDELLTLTKTDRAREIALTVLAGGAMMKTGLDMEARILECIECSGQYSLLDLKAGRFDAETLTCDRCYRRMREAPVEVSCFGKLKTDEHEGYSEADAECRLYCMDRKSCKQHLNKRGEIKMVPETEQESSAEDILGGVDFSKVKSPAKAKAKAKGKPNGHAKLTAKESAQLEAKVSKGKKAVKPVKKVAAKAAKSKGEPKEVKQVKEIRPDSMTAKLFEMLAAGTRRDQMAKKAGWNDHSVRGFLSGATKSYNVEIVSELTGNKVKCVDEKSGKYGEQIPERIYKLKGKPPAVAKKK
jgi:hypothetical protein